LPITTFIFLKWMTSQVDPAIEDAQNVKTLLIIAFLVLIIDLTTVHWLYKLKKEKLKNLIEIARKMDGFYTLTLMKLGSYCGTCLIMAFGFYLTHNHFFTGLFGILTLLIVIQWPTSSLFCRQFNLKGNDRDMIMKSGDMIKK